MATLVGLNQGGDNVEAAGKDVAMQIAAMNPVALNKESIPEDVIAKELEIGKRSSYSRRETRSNG